MRPGSPAPRGGSPVAMPLADGPDRAAAPVGAGASAAARARGQLRRLRRSQRRRETMEPVADPIVLGSAEWQRIAKGLAQRARLLAAILAHMSVPSGCSSRGTCRPNPLRALGVCAVRRHRAARRSLPPALRGGPRAPRRRRNRGARRSNARPSGAGYALENRIVLARTLPDVFRESASNASPSSSRHARLPARPGASQTATTRASRC